MIRGGRWRPMRDTQFVLLLDTPLFLGKRMKSSCRCLPAAGRTVLEVPHQAEKLRPSIHFCSNCESVDLAKKLPSRALGGG